MRYPIDLLSMIHNNHSYQINIKSNQYQTKLQTLGHTSLSSSWFDKIYEISHWPTINSGSMIHNNHSYQFKLISNQYQTQGQTSYLSFFLHKYTFWALHMKACKLWQNLPKFLKISQNFSKNSKFSPKILHMTILSPQI